MYLISQFQRIQSGASKLHYTRSEKRVNMKVERACYVGTFLCHSEHEELGKRTRGMIFSSIWMWWWTTAIPALRRWRHRQEDQELKDIFNYVVN